MGPVFSGNGDHPGKRYGAGAVEHDFKVGEDKFEVGEQEYEDGEHELEGAALCFSGACVGMVVA